MEINRSHLLRPPLLECIHIVAAVLLPLLPTAAACCYYFVVENKLLKLNSNIIHWSSETRRLRVTSTTSTAWRVYATPRTFPKTTRPSTSIRAYVFYRTRHLFLMQISIFFLFLYANTLLHTHDCFKCVRV